MIILYGVSGLFNYIQAIGLTVVTNKFAFVLRDKITKKINKLPLRYFDLHQFGDILSRVTNDVDSIAQSMNQSFGLLVHSITLFFGSIFMMFYTNWIMALTAIGASLLGFFGMSFILKNSHS